MFTTGILSMSALRPQIALFFTGPNYSGKLTLFLRIPGVPLDNNIAERMLKMAIRHRCNSLSYKTRRGANVGDV